MKIEISQILIGMELEMFVTTVPQLKTLIKTTMMETMLEMCVIPVGMFLTQNRRWMHLKFMEKKIVRLNLMIPPRILLLLKFWKCFCKCTIVIRYVIRND